MMRIICLFFVVLLMGCKSETFVDIQGHRGCRGLLPENTLIAFEKAIDLGVHTLELDLAVTKDGHVIVSHEPYMNSVICTDSLGHTIPKENAKQFNIYQMIYEEVKLFDCGSLKHPGFPEQILSKTYKPLLSEVFQMAEAKNPNIRYNIEIKAKPQYDGIYTPSPKEFVSLVLEVINNNKVFERSNLQSFDLRILEEVKQQAPNMPVAVLVDDNENINTKVSQLSFKPEIISPYFKLLNEEKVLQLHNENFKVIPWTVNEISDFKTVLSYNVDGIITDYPDRLIQLLKN